MGEKRGGVVRMVSLCFVVCSTPTRSRYRELGIGALWYLPGMVFSYSPPVIGVRDSLIHLRTVTRFSLTLLTCAFHFLLQRHHPTPLPTCLFA